MITAELLKETHKACYTIESLRELFPEPRTLRDVLTLRSGPWEFVSDADRVWVACHILTLEQLDEFVSFLRANAHAYAHAHAYARAYAYTYAHARAHARAYTYAHAHARGEQVKIILGILDKGNSLQIAKNLP